MKKLIDQLKNVSLKYYVLAIFALITLTLVVMFLKPNPIVRINPNKFVGQNDSALTLNAPVEIDGVGKEFEVTVEVDTNGSYINSVQSYLIFDPNVLEITNSSTEESFCKYYPENNYSNEKGKVKLACGSPYPGFRGKDTIQRITFLAKAITTTEIKFGDSMVLANDGKGTNLLKKTTPVQIKIKAAL